MQYSREYPNVPLWQRIDEYLTDKHTRPDSYKVYPEKHGTNGRNYDTRKNGKNGKRWQQYEDDFLLENYVQVKTKSMKDIAIELSRTPETVQKRIQFLTQIGNRPRIDKRGWIDTRWIREAEKRMKRNLQLPK